MKRAMDPALLARVARHPTDLTVRLSVAESVQAEAPDLAEFVRNGVTMAREGRDAADYDRRERTQRILFRRAAREALCEPHAEWLSAWVLHGGWVEGGTTDAADFLAHAEARFDTLPLMYLTLRDAGPHLAAILEAPWVARLRGLVLPAARLADDDARRLAEAPGLAELRWLGLYDNEIGLAGLEALAASPHLRTLRYLDLRNNPAPPHVRRPILDQSEVIGWEPCPHAEALVRAHGPRPWLDRADAVMPAPAWV